MRIVYNLETRIGVIVQTLLVLLCMIFFVKDVYVCERFVLVIAYPY